MTGYLAHTFGGAIPRVPGAVIKNTCLIALWLLSLQLRLFTASPASFALASFLRLPCCVPGAWAPSFSTLSHLHADATLVSTGAQGRAARGTARKFPSVPPTRAQPGAAAGCRTPRAAVHPALGFWLQVCRRDSEKWGQDFFRSRVKQSFEGTFLFPYKLTLFNTNIFFLCLAKNPVVWSFLSLFWMGKDAS